MANRRDFLKLLGIAPVAPMALRLDPVIAAIPEPTVEKIINYTSSEKITTGVLHLEDVIPYRGFFDNLRNEPEKEPENILALRGSKYEGRQYKEKRIELSCKPNDGLMPLFESHNNDCCISFDIQGKRVICVGMVVQIQEIYDIDHIRNGIEMILSEPLIVR